MQVTLTHIVRSRSLLLVFLTAISAAAQDAQDASQDDALRVIEGVRGGRHWVDDRTAPPKSPSESLACLEIEPGLEVQLVAAEPLVMDPVAIAFDRRGRMFVVEYGDYPTGPEAGGKSLSRVVLLEDTDGDGVMDRRQVYADELTFAHSLMPWDDGLLVGAQTQILFLKDADGDDVAEIREVLFDGFTPAHPQMQIGNPRWGMDNWIYLNYAPGKITSSRRPGDPVTLPRKDMRFHPKTLEFEEVTGLGQFGNTIDRWGHRFFCTNRNPIMTDLLSPALQRRNRWAVLAPVHYDVGRSGGDTRVYPLVEMKSNYLSHAGTHTSACGVTACLADQLGPRYADSVFVCEPIGHLVTHSVVAWQGARLTAARARPRADFLASTDTWFRPASLASGPDGALYLADMYRLWVEHPKFLPPEIAAKLDWRAGDDRGRIYRILAKGTRPARFKPPTDLAETVSLLNEASGWRRFLGQRLLVQGGHTQAAAKIRQLLKTGSAPTTRLQALWTLDGLGVLQQDDVRTGLIDPDPHVRRDAVRLAARWVDEPAVASLLADRARDEVTAVRFQTAVTLGVSSTASSTEMLSQLALRDGRDVWFARGLLTSVAERAGSVLAELLTDPAFVGELDHGATRLLRDLASVVGSRGDLDELGRLLTSLAAAEPPGAGWRAAVISGLGQGLPRHRGGLGRTSLPKLLASPPRELAPIVASLGELFAQNRQASLDADRSPAERAAAVALLAYEPFETAAPAFDELLRGGQPADVQAACITALSANGSPQAASIVLERWGELGPSVRDSALTLLLRRVESTRLTLQAMSDGHMQPAALSIDQRVRLLKHSNAELRRHATELFGGAVSSNRRGVAEQYTKALELPASRVAGLKVFDRICAKCHRLDGRGHEAGPDLSDVRNRSRLALLYDILDPNAKVEPRFTSYAVVTVDGKTYNGLVTEESAEAVVLRMAEGKQETIGRAEIDEIRASNVSLMPEGVEKDITLQQMADLLEFLKSR